MRSGKWRMCKRSECRKDFQGGKEFEGGGGEGNAGNDDSQGQIVFTQGAIILQHTVMEVQSRVSYLSQGFEDNV